MHFDVEVNINPKPKPKPESPRKQSTTSARAARRRIDLRRAAATFARAAASCAVGAPRSAGLPPHRAPPRPPQSPQEPGRPPRRLLAETHRAAAFGPPSYTFSPRDPPNHAFGSFADSYLSPDPEHGTHRNRTYAGDVDRNLDYYQCTPNTARLRLASPAPMSDLGLRRRPTVAEVVGRLKDDGDFDSLRRTIIRKVKGNEALRNSIISEVKQSLIVQEDGSEKLKLKDLSDAIFQDIGSKIMGQISDEVWNVIQSNETDIRGTVQAVYNRIVHPEKGPEPSLKRLKSTGKEEQVPLSKPTTSIAVEVDDDGPEEPPGFGFSNNHKHNVTTTAVTPQQPSNLENHKELKPNGEPVAVGSAGDCDDDDDDDDNGPPPGFG